MIAAALWVVFALAVIAGTYALLTAIETRWWGEPQE